MKLKDVQGALEKTVTVSARIPISYKEWLRQLPTPKSKDFGMGLNREFQRKS